MSYATTVIGIGGTGVRAVRALKYRYFSSLQPESRVQASFLAVDFDRSVLDEVHPQGRLAKLDDDETLYLRAEAIQEFLRNIDRAQDGEFAWQAIREWFPDPETHPVPVSDIEANGARQLRALGRAGFFLNDSILETTIRRKLCEPKPEVDVRNITSGSRVILMGSLAGGTGAGMLTDLAYLIRRQPQRPKVYLYLLLPEVFQDVDTGGRTYQNAYAMLKELAYLKDQQIPFHAQYPSIQPIHVEVGREEPFARIFLIRGNTCSGSGAITEACEAMAKTVLAQLHRTVQERTLSIAANTVSTVSKKEQRRKRTHCFSTAGNVVIRLNEVSLPSRSLLEEALAELRAPQSSALDTVKLKMLRGLVIKVEQNPVPTKHDGLPVTVPESEFDESALPAAENSSEKPLRQLAVSWHRQIAAASSTAAKLLVKDLSNSIESLRSGGELVLTDGSDSRAEGLRRLVLGPIGGDSTRNSEESNHGKSDGNIDGKSDEPSAEPTSNDQSWLLLVRKHCPSFTPFDEQLRRTMRGWLEGFTSETDSASILARWQFLSSLLDRDRLFTPPPDLSSKLEEAGREVVSELESPAALRKELEAERNQGFLARFNIGNKDLDQQAYTRWYAGELLKVVEKPHIEAFHRNAFRKRAHQIWRAELGNLRKNFNEHVQNAVDLGNRLQALDRVEKRLEDLPESQQKPYREFLSRIQPELYQFMRELPEDIEKGPFTVRVTQWMHSMIAKAPELQGIGLVLPEEAKEDVYRQLVLSRQQVFERRTPNPQRTGFGLIFIPARHGGAGGAGEMRTFLQATTSQLLDVRAQVETYEGNDIWIYFEDLFNPPDHIWNLDEYYRRYQGDDAKALFHIDRTFLENPVFREIHSAASGQITVCGNRNCQENIADQARGQLICRGCAQPIRSRCGNPQCHEDELHKHPDGEKKICPACSGYNYGSWWQCSRHGKLPVDVPIDKIRCPTCIREHLANPTSRGLKDISKRPDLVGAMVCPRCEDLMENDPSYRPFRIPKSLQGFYTNGVNGHDRQKFEDEATRVGLSSKVRCPKCRTILIPTHHELS